MPTCVFVGEPFHPGGIAAPSGLARRSLDDADPAGRARQVVPDREAAPVRR
jgi:hypothetical protein